MEAKEREKAKGIWQDFLEELKENLVTIQENIDTLQETVDLLWREVFGKGPAPELKPWPTTKLNQKSEEEPKGKEGPKEGPNTNPK